MGVREKLREGKLMMYETSDGRTFDDAEKAVDWIMSDGCGNWCDHHDGGPRHPGCDGTGPEHGCDTLEGPNCESCAELEEFYGKYDL